MTKNFKTEKEILKIANAAQGVQMPKRKKKYNIFTYNLTEVR